MSPADLSSNYFEVFDIPVSFEINLAELSEKFRSLQSVAHPDNFASGSDAQRLLSVQRSALINEAYQTLREPLARSIYLLKLKGWDLGQDSATHMDTEFLMQQMELREQLAGISGAGDPMEAVLEFNARVEALSSQVYDELKPVLKQMEQAGQDAVLEQAKDLVRRLQFLNKLQQECQALEEQFI